MVDEKLVWFVNSNIYPKVPSYRGFIIYKTSNFCAMVLWRWEVATNVACAILWHLVDCKQKTKAMSWPIFFLGSFLQEKRGKKCSVFDFQSPSSPSSLSSTSSVGFAIKAARRRRFFCPSSPSHPSKLYPGGFTIQNVCISHVNKGYFPRVYFDGGGELNTPYH